MWSKTKVRNKCRGEKTKCWLPIHPFIHSCTVIMKSKNEWMNSTISQKWWKCHHRYTLLSCLIPKIFARKIRNILKKRKIFRKQNNENKTCIVQGKMRDIFFKKEIALVFVQCIMRCIMSKYDHCKIDHWKEKLKKLLLFVIVQFFFHFIQTTTNDDDQKRKCLKKMLFCQLDRASNHNV